MSPFASCSSFVVSSDEDEAERHAGFFSKIMSLIRANQYPGCCMEFVRSGLARMLPRGSRLPIGLSARGFFGMPVFMMEVQPKARRFACPGDFEGKFSACAVLLKEGIDRLQQNRFPARRHLRQLRVQFQHTVKIKSFSVEAVLPRHVRMRSRNQKMQIGEREN